MNNIEMTALILHMMQHGGMLDTLEEYSRTLTRILHEENEARKAIGCIGVGLIVTAQELKYDDNKLLSKEAADNGTS